VEGCLDPSYRLQISWTGKHFVLYFRSLLDGVLPEAEAAMELPFFTGSYRLALPHGSTEVEAYRLSTEQLVEFMAQDQNTQLWGGDALWLLSVMRWLLRLFENELWFPEVTRNGDIRINLLLDSAQTRAQAKQLKEALPQSLLAAHPEPESKTRGWLNLLRHLADGLGWHLVLEPPVWFPEDRLEKLPKPYRKLLSDLVSGRKSTFSECNFFDSRQASLTLTQRVSSLAFKLVPPELSGECWQIRPQLQSISHPETYVDALEGWENPGSLPRELVPPGTSPRLHLLKEFGRALRLMPVLGASLATSPPSPLTYDETEMSRFLGTEAEMLRSFGYELIAPRGLERAQTPEASLQLLDKHQSGVDLQQLLDFQWNLVIDEALLDPEALERWREQPSPLFFSNGRWYWLDSKATMKLLRLVDKQARRGTLLDAMQLATEISALRLQFEGDLAPLGRSHKFEELSTPESFRGQLRDYQMRGYSWLRFMRSLGLGACLADDMGLGKTVQALALMCSLKEKGELAPALLVCPTSVLGNWQREANRFAPDLRVTLHHGQRSSKLDPFKSQLEETDLLLTSYSLLNRDRRLFLALNWSIIVLDEAQQIKNPNSKVSKLTSKLSADSRLLLTGTPVENRLQDLWTLFRFMQPELLGSKRKFQSRFASPIEKRGDDSIKRQLRRIVGPFILRRTKMDPAVASELPPRVDTVVECSLTPEQAKIYEGEVREALQSIQGLQGFDRKGSIVRLLTRLKQLCNHPALLEEFPVWNPDRSGKMHRLFQILKELSPREGVLIFSQFTSMLKVLKRALTETQGEEVLLLDGSTPREARDEMVDRFQSGIGPRLFCISLKAGGVGLNLTRASSVVHFDRWWNPAVEAQATDRAHRIGQTQTVQVFKFVTLSTLEEQIARILQSKESLVSGLIEDGDSWLTELNDRELSDLLLPNQPERRVLS
jgi:superfamily II DNA or RNA helicase